MDIIKRTNVMTGRNLPGRGNMISVLITVYNLADDVDSLHVSLKEALTQTGRKFELVFIDDGSTDQTRKRLQEIAGRHKSVRVVRLRSTFGEGTALQAGLDHSRGEEIVYLSGRVRVNPSDIPGLLERLSDKTDFVVGWRNPRRDSLLNRFVSRAFNRMVNVMSRMRLHDINSGIFVTRRSVLDRLTFYGDLYNFLPVLACQQGYRVSEEKIEQLPGAFRNSRNPKAYLRRLLDIITVFFLTRYSKKPIHFLGFVGMIFFLMGLGIEIYLFIYRILEMGAIAGRPLLLLGALMLVIGIQMISIGLLGEMMIFTHAGDIAEYNIEEIINP